MGNVPISCCRSKSPNSQQSSSGRGNCRNGLEGQYSSTNNDLIHGDRFSRNRQRDNQDGNQPSHILQHISEREPDDSETDPSSNPFNHPIFTSRSRSNTKSKICDSYSSNNSQIRRHTHTPLTSSQDHGYNSTTSTNATHYGLLQDSLDSSINRQRLNERDTLNFDDKKSNTDNRLFLSSSSESSDDLNKSSPSINRIEQNHFTIREDADVTSSDCKKSSSCSTIFIDGSTISQPDLKQTMKCVSLAIYYHIKNRTSDNSVEIFDESIHPLKMPTSSSTPDPQTELIALDHQGTSNDRLTEPNQRTIYNFVKTLFKAAQLTSEYAITTLVYLERLMTYAEMDLTPKTWRRMFLGAILLSSKVWEDQAVWNVDYAQILEEISVDDINELERHFLELIQFNMNVPSSVYAKYYFHLRTLASKNDLSKEFNLLTVDQAKTLEAMSRVQISDWQSSPIHRKTPPERKRHASLERVFSLGGRTKAVLM